MAYPHTFNGLAGNIPLQYLDDNFSALSASGGSALVGDIIAATGAVAHTLASKTGKVWDPILDFGAIGDGVADDTAAWQALATALNAAGGGVVVSQPGKTYSIYNSVPTPPAFTTFLGLTNCTGLYFDMNGSKFKVMGNFATNTAVLYLMLLTGCSYVYIKDWRFIQNTAFIPGGSPYGVMGIYESNCSNTVIINPYSEAGLGTFQALQQTSDPATLSSRRIYGLGGYSLNCEYGLSFANSGDNVVWKGFETSGVGRSYFAYGCQDHDVSIASRNCKLQDCVINAGGQTGNARPTTNLRINYKSYPRTDSSTSGNPNVFIGATGSSSGVTGFEISNIDLKLDIDQSADVGTNGPALVFSKSTVNPLSSTFNNIKISGLIKATTNVYNVLDLCLLADAPWTSETLQNICLDDLVIVGGGGNPFVRIDFAGIKNPVSMKSLYAPNVKLATSGTPQIATYNTALSAFSRLNYTGTFTPVLVSAGGGAAVYTSTGSYTVVGDRVHFSLNITLTGLGTLAAGILSITGFPFTVLTGQNFPLQVYGSALAVAAATQLDGILPSNSSTIYPAKYATGAQTNLNQTDLTATSALYICGTVQIP